MKDITFNRFIEHFFYNVDSRSKGVFASNYEEVIKNIIKPHFKNCKLKNISPFLLNMFKNHCIRYNNNQKDVRYKEAYLLVLDAIEYARKNNLITNIDFINHYKKKEHKKKIEEQEMNNKVKNVNKFNNSNISNLIEDAKMNKRYKKLKKESGSKEGNYTSSSFVLDGSYLNPNNINLSIDSTNNINEIKRLKNEGRLEC